MKKLNLIPFALYCLLTMSLVACGGDEPIIFPEPEPEGPVAPVEPEKPKPEVTWSEVAAQPDAWDKEKRADISYQLLLYSFADGNGDKYGDINGLISKLDYINSLGVRAIWLSPIHPSPSYHGYDVMDYTTVKQEFGTEADFDRLIAEAHRRDIRVYLDYVLNHTSVQHPWFLEARASEDNPKRGYYLFSQNPEADIKAGRLDMFEQGGFSSGEWFSTTASDDVMKGCYRFVLDWANPANPTLTVTKAEKADIPNPDQSTTNAKYLYFGDPAHCHKFYDKGNGKYELAVDFASSWGFLVRTSNTLWDDHKYGAPSSDVRLKLGETFVLKQGGGAADILFESMKLWYFHSHFNTASFADINYGKLSDLKQSLVYKEVVDAAKGWIDRGVDGFRLDAVKHIYHSATSSENPTFLRVFYDDLNSYYKQKGKNDELYMVGEVLSGANEVAPYYQGLPALFEFDFWNRLQWAINNGTGCYFAKDILEYQRLYAGYRKDYIEATKLSNHDEDRTASVLGKSLAKEKLAAAVLLTAAGSPYIYYGEELGMYGTHKDLLGGDEYRRAPMLWGDNSVTAYTDKIDNGMAAAIKPVAEQEADANSLLNVYMRFARLRNTYPALALGVMSKHATYNESNTTTGKAIAAWYMTKEAQKMLVVHNFGAAEVEVTLTDAIDKAVGTNGTIRQATDGSNTVVKISGYGSVVFKLK